ncbi:MFS transporter [Phenylobacterium sp.]|uniref:MFS transporter n=1 Tax=Phenylobacterium sp. TaxID=1871053 RepID=UPI00286AF759|nr:MFS transporter [Phenylobacterium sp.]
MTAKAAGRLGPGLIVAICFSIAALEGYDIQAFGVAVPRMAPDLGLGPSQLGLAGSAAMLGLAIGALTGGWAADRFGRRPVLTVSVAFFGVFSVVTALSQSYEMLVLARLATGLGFGGAMPNMMAIATEISPPNRRAITTTSMFCGLPAGGAAVALLAQFGGDAVDWRTIFLIGGALPLLLAPVVFFFLPETRPAQSEQVDRRVVHGLFGERRGLATSLIWLVFALDLLVTYLLLNWLPTLMVAKGFTPQDGAQASFWMNIASVVGALLLGWLADRAGYRWLLVTVFAGLAVALYGLSQFTEIGGLFAAAAAAGFAVVGGLYILYALAPTYYPPGIRAAGSGAAIAVGRLGSIAGPLIAGQLRAAGFGPDQVLLTLVPAAVFTAVGVFALTTFCRPHRQD